MLRFVTALFMILGLVGCSTQASGYITEPTTEETVSESLGRFGTLVAKIEVEYGFDATSEEWAEVRDKNCSDTENMNWFPGVVSEQFDQATQDAIATKTWAASVIAECRSKVALHSLDQAYFDAFSSLDPSYTAEKYLQPEIRLASLGQFGALAAQLENTYVFEATVQEWADARDKSCSSITSTSYVKASPQISNPEATVMAWAAAIVTTCPESITPYTWSGDELAALTWADPNFAAQLNQSGVGGGGGNYAPPATGGGYTVQCNDGTFSNSGGKQGACSWHGGVAG